MSEVTIIGDAHHHAFVSLKTEDQQARAMLFHTRQMFGGQRSQMIKALR